MVVSSIDGAGQMIPIAFGICHGESQDTWTWFVRLLDTALVFPLYRSLSWSVNERKDFIRLFHHPPSCCSTPFVCSISKRTSRKQLIPRKKSSLEGNKSTKHPRVLGDHRWNEYSQFESSRICFLDQPLDVGACVFPVSSVQTLDLERRGICQRLNQWCTWTTSYSGAVHHCLHGKRPLLPSQRGIGEAGIVICSKEDRWDCHLKHGGRKRPLSRTDRKQHVPSAKIEREIDVPCC